MSAKTKSSKSQTKKWDRRKQKKKVTPATGPVQVRTLTADELAEKRLGVRRYRNAPKPWWVESSDGLPAWIEREDDR